MGARFAPIGRSGRSASVAVEIDDDSELRVSPPDSAGRELADRSRQLQLAASVAWRNYLGAVAAAARGALPGDAPERAFTQYSCARSLHLAAEEALIDHIKGRTKDPRHAE